MKEHPGIVLKERARERAAHLMPFVSGGRLRDGEMERNVSNVEGMYNQVRKTGFGHRDSGERSERESELRERGGEKERETDREREKETDGERERLEADTGR